MKLKYIPFLFLSILLIQCSSPQKLLNKGKYDKAYEAALKRLEKDKADRKDKTVLIKALNEILKTDLAKANVQADSDDIFEAEKGYMAYVDIEEKVKAAMPYAVNEFDNSLEFVVDQKEQLRVNLKEGFLDIGFKDLEEYDRTERKVHAQDAYEMFRRGARYVEPDLEMRELLESTLEKATINYMVEADAFFIEFAVDGIFRDIERASRGFDRIYFERYNIEDIDCYIEIDFDDVDFGIDANDRTRSYTERILVERNVTIDSSGNEIDNSIYEDVSGTVTTITERKLAYLQADTDIRSYSKNCELRDQRFDAELVSEIEFYQLSGDDRAIPNEFKNTRQEQHVRDDQMIEDLIIMIYEEFLDYYFDQ